MTAIPVSFQSNSTEPPPELITRNSQPIRHFRQGKADLVEALNGAFADALEYQGKLSPEILAIQGMSGKKYRYFINNLIERLQSPRYLEVGSWLGSTLCAAIYKNNVTAVAIDNWSQFAGPVADFFRNLGNSCSLENRVSVLSKDFRYVDFKSLGTFNVYLFDGPHEYQDQYDGLLMALPALDNRFIFIVDDWNWRRVREGTYACIADLGLTIVTSIEVRSTSEEDGNPSVAFQDSDWHNGYFISILQK